MDDRGSTERIKKLLADMEEKAWSDRSSDWLKPEWFKDIVGDEQRDEPVIVRRAMAIDEMLKALGDPEHPKTEHTYEIRPGEQIVGVIAMGSLGLGKVFPTYLTDDERDVGSISSKTETSLFGHDSVNYQRLVDEGLQSIVKECDYHFESIKEHLAGYESLKVALGEDSWGKIVAACANENLKRKLKKIADAEDHSKLGRRLRVFDEDIGILFEQISSCGDGKSVRAYIAALIDKVDEKTSILHNKRDFYRAVMISCKAVIEYARQHAILAENMVGHESDAGRKEELNEIARICRKVPAGRADTFHEALQSIYFIHLALHSSMNQLSLGRLDQVLQRCYDSDPCPRPQKLELFECFLIKCAERLVLDASTFVKQDQLDFGSSLATNPVPLDQWAEVNQFLQNLVVGGLTREGEDAVNECTYLILDAFRSTRMYTPTLNARLHQVHIDGNRRYLTAVARTIYETKNGMPLIGNDNVLIKSLEDADLPREEARDYVIDGCWEPLLNGNCDWTYRMTNLLDALECALNRGAMLTSDPVLLRGEKLSHLTAPPPENNEEMGFAGLQELMKTHINFFTNQAALSVYKLYLIDQAVYPSPLYSTFLKGCMESGRDKSWGGSEYRLAGVVSAGIPQTVNTLAAIEKWVYQKKEFSIGEVTDALRFNFDAGEDRDQQQRYDQIKGKFQSWSPKFGGSEKEDERATEIMTWLLGELSESVKSSVALAELVFLKKPSPKDEKRIVSLRAMAGYSGLSMEEEFGEDFRIRFTTGVGTFELFNLMGNGSAATSDREGGDPLTRNFSPIIGSTESTASHILSTFGDLGLHRFGAGVVTDVCLDQNELSENEEEAIQTIEALIKFFHCHNGNMLTLSITNQSDLENIYDLCERYRAGDQQARSELRRYESYNVRVAGYQAPFITLPKQHQERYIQRPVAP